MVAELALLRHKIDVIDKTLLKLIAQRMKIVAKVGAIKKNYGLPIYVPEREKYILALRRKEAKKLGLSPSFFEDIIRRIISESYIREYNQGVKPIHVLLRPIVIIGGKGKMGRFFEKILLLSKYQVNIFDKEDWDNAEQILKNAAMVIISVPIQITKEIISKLPRLPHDCIMVDISSVKIIPIQAMLAAHTGPVLGLHPMFAPDSEHPVRKVIILCHGRFPEAYQWFLEQLTIWGFKIHNISAIEHDKNMAFIQAFRHFSNFVYGVHLLEENVNLANLLKLASPIYKLELKILARFFNQNPHLYVDIIMASDFNLTLIKHYYHCFGKLIELIEQKDRNKFLENFIKVKDWFSVHLQECIMNNPSCLR
ncbi:MAG: bifunctional chorismate mutase/prephenate dehydrogenase [Candidatus Dasytiphilus stammeri]